MANIKAQFIPSEILGGNVHPDNQDIFNVLIKATYGKNVLFKEYDAEKPELTFEELKTMIVVFPAIKVFSIVSFIYKDKKHIAYVSEAREDAVVTDLYSCDDEINLGTTKFEKCKDLRLATPTEIQTFKSLALRRAGVTFNDKTNKFETEFMKISPGSFIVGYTKNGKGFECFVSKMVGTTIIAGVSKFYDKTEYTIGNHEIKNINLCSIKLEAGIIRNNFVTGLQEQTGRTWNSSAVRCEPMGIRELGKTYYYLDASFKECSAIYEGSRTDVNRIAAGNVFSNIEACSEFREYIAKYIHQYLSTTHDFDDYDVNNIDTNKRNYIGSFRKNLSSK